MKTKFILHGGFASHINQQNDSFFKEILLGLNNSVNILLVYFAKELDRIPENRDEDIFMFNKNKENLDLFFETADEENFSDQVKRADVIYLHGGSTLKLLEALKKFPNLEGISKGKIIAGESAGAYVLSSMFFSKLTGGVFQGLGFVLVKLICHYSEEKKDKLRGVEDDLETLLLSDYEYKVFTVN